MDERAVITAPGPFEGLDRFEARPAVLAALRAEGRIVAERRPYLHAVGHCHRCGTTVEPRLSLQWFVKVGPLAKAAGDAVRDGRVQIHPREHGCRATSTGSTTCTTGASAASCGGATGSRSGTRLTGEAVCVGPEGEPPSGEGWTQDSDVLDTWFSSALWPFSTLGWPDDTPDLRAFYPTSVAGDRLRHPVLLGRPDDDVRPVRDGRRGPDNRCRSAQVALHGLVRDKFGKKMSKSRGNTVDPLDWIDRFGADATRFTLARGASPGGDVAVSEEWVAGARNFCNKLWNATRFALINGAVAGRRLPARQAGCRVPDRWILSRLAAVIAEVDELFEQFEFAKVCDALYHFAWDEFCDWYLELAKAALTGPDDAAADATRRVLGARARPAAAAAPSGDAVRHRRAVDGADRRRVGGDGALAGPTAPAASGGGRRGGPGGCCGCGGGGRDRSLMRLVTAGPAVPRGPGPAAHPAGARPRSPASRRRRWPGTRRRIRSLLRLHQPGCRFAPTASVQAEGMTVRLDTAAAIDVGAERRQAGEGSRRRTGRCGRGRSASSPARRSSSGLPPRWWPRAGTGWPPRRPR